MYNGDRTHGVDGFYCSISEYFCIDSGNRELVLNLIGWASKKTRLSRIPLIDQYQYQRKYSKKIAILRMAGLIGLKRIYKHLTALDELEKRYFTYLNSVREKEVASSGGDEIV